MISGKERRSGISVVGDIPAGTHLCQFYQTKQDLIDILVPFFKAGLESNEFCLWVTSKPLVAEDAKSALNKAVPNLNHYISEGQIKLIDYKDWYIRKGKFDVNDILRACNDEEKQALERGFNGVRASGNLSWYKKGDWPNLRNYEQLLEDGIYNHQCIALCSYCIDKLEASEVLDIVRNHQLALIRREGKWEIIQRVKNIEGSRRQLERALWWAEKRYRLLADNIEEVIWIVDTVLYNQLTYISPSVTRLLGYSVDEAKAKMLEEVFTPESIEFLQQTYEQEIDKVTMQPRDMSKSRALEVKMKHKDGSIVPIELKFSFLPSPGGSTEILAVARRITERKPRI